MTVSQQDNAEEALDTINSAQLHYDAHYASQTEWKNCLGVSTMMLQRVMGMTSKTFHRKLGIIEFVDIAMTHPVFGGDTLYAESTIKTKEDYPENNDVGLLTVITRGINQNGDEVAKIEYKILVYKAGKHPLDNGDTLHSSGVEDDKFASHRLLEDGTFIERWVFITKTCCRGKFMSTAREKRLRKKKIACTRCARLSFVHSIPTATILHSFLKMAC